MLTNRVLIVFLTLFVVHSQLTIAEEGPMVEVRTSSADIQLNEQGRNIVLGKVRKGKKLWALETKGEFYRVIEPATLRAGWIWNKHATPVNYTDQQNMAATAFTAKLAEATEAERKNDAARAIRFRKEAIVLAEKVWGENAPATSNTIHNLGIVYMGAADYSNAELAFDRALRIRKRLYGIGHAKTVKTLRQLGTLYGLQANLKAAEEVLVKVVHLSRRSGAENQKGLAEALNELGFFYVNSGKYAEGEKAFRESLSIREATQGTDGPAAAQSMNNIAWALWSQQKYNAAEPLFRRALEINRQELNPDDYLIATNLINCASVYDGLLEYGRSRPLYEEALAIAEKTLGSDHLRTADALSSLAENHIAVGSYHIAETLAQRALSINKKKLGPKHPRVVRELGTLAAIYSRQGNHQKAEPLVKKALEISQETYGRNHSFMVHRHYALGMFYFRKADYVNAHDSFDSAIQIAVANDGNAPAYLLGVLGRTFARLGNLSKSKELLRKAIKLKSTELGKSHPTTLKDVSSLSVLNAHDGDVTEAIQLQDQCQQGMREHLVKILPTMAEHARTTYLESGFADTIDLGLSIGHLYRDNRRTTTISAAWLLNAKAMGQEASAESALLSSPETVEQVKELQDVRSQLAKITLEKAGQVDEATRQELAALEARQNQLQQQISAHGLGLSESDPWITTGQLMGKIPFDSVFINIARFRKFKFGALELSGEDRWGPEIYVAWIVPSAGAGEVHVVDLGDAATIDRHVAALRSNLDSTVLTHLTENGETIVEEEYLQQAQALSQLVFAPIEPHLSDVRELILSPDSELWTVPWEALRTQNDEYVIEQFETRYVLSGRELIYHLPERGLIGPPVIFADPNYDMTGAKVLTNKTHNRHSLRSAANMHFPRLKQTAVEALAIKPRIEAFTKSPARVLMQDEAQEATFKELHRPRVLVLSTHGYFQPASQNSRNGNVEERQNVSNSLLRCGLALAGCNQKSTSAEKDDGILTGLEIVGTDLRGTELVVLSACETGLGDIQNGEGVAGLRQAFQLAGAKSIVSTLWQVEDGETSRLMEAFFDHMAEGGKLNEALRNAKLDRIASRRARNGSAHPFFWAAFTLTGQD